MMAKKEFANFIVRFQMIDWGLSVAFSILVFEIFNYYDAMTFTMFTLVSLVINSALMKRYGYLLDVYCQKKILSVITGLIGVLTALVAIFDTSWLYLLFYLCGSLFFTIFYPIYNAMSQILKMDNTSFVSSSMEVSDKIVSLLSCLFVWYFYDIVGSQLILTVCAVVILSIMPFLHQLPQSVRLPSSNNHSSVNNSSVNHSSTNATTSVKLSKQLSEAEEDKSNLSAPVSTPVSNKDLGFAWMFSQPIFWLISLTIICNLMVLQSNTINSAYLYQVLQESPETLSLIGAAFSVGSLCSSIISFWLTDEKKAIYLSFILSAVMSILIAVQPIVMVFMLVMFVFGFSNSLSRVMSRSLIMKSIANSQSATFYALRGSLVSAIRFAYLALMTLVTVVSPKLIVWFFPASLVVLVLLWFGKNYFQQDKRMNNLCLST